ncbi:YezD family protein [Sphingobium sp. Cam5-1]|uniref:YezD family protein n=1 Tax=Sphingobium sp. Cam5-1 TaxID=2789327 RepID=UPI0018AD2D75|nr:YezD family protein [Sphingobium sp. Cam5-1]QPI71868.1 YezD family protein [Sphingobium sp. Cam5-1]
MSDSRPTELARNGRADGQRADISVSIEKVRGALEALRFGSITLTVHDARVVQIDVTEKTRLTA